MFAAVRRFAIRYEPISISFEYRHEFDAMPPMRQNTYLK